MLEVMQFDYAHLHLILEYTFVMQETTPKRPADTKTDNESQVHILLN
jgi:hypothetical protein